MTSQLVLPSSDDPVVAGAVQALGGPPGRYARLGRRRLWTPVLVVVALTLLTSLLGFAQKAPCRDGSTWVHEHQYTRACYTDVVALYGAEGLSAGKVPYYDHPVEYPVVIGGVMQLSALLARGLARALPDSRVDQARRTGNVAVEDYARVTAAGRHFYDITWALVTLCALVVAVTTSRLAGRRPWDAALFALSPGLLLHATTNWDLIATALAGLGLLAWARRHPVWAGVLLGLATATKLYPVLFLVPLLGLCLRAGKLREWGALAALTVVTAVGVTAPVYLTAPSFADRGGQQVEVLGSPLSRLGSDGLGALLPVQCRVTSGPAVTTSYGRCSGAAPAGASQEQVTNAVWRFVDLNSSRGADWDSLYLQLQRLHTDQGVLKGLRNAVSGAFTESDVPPGTLNATVAVLALLVMVAVVVLALRAPRRPRVAQLLFLTVTGFLLVNKVDSPQYVLWLIPLAVLARPRWRLFLAWQVAEALLLLSRFYFFIGNDKPGEGVGIGWFFACVLLRDLLLLAVAALVVRDVLHPEHDVVRRDGVDDPAGGVLDGAPDRAPALA